MRRQAFGLFLFGALCFCVFASSTSADDASSARYETLHIMIDAGDRPLAAYQVTFDAPPGVQIVGIEGGEHAAFAEPPYYDPKAIQHHRAVLAAFSVDDAAALPTGVTRVATLHLRVASDVDSAPDYDIELTVAADPAGEPIDATANLKKGDR